MDTELMTDDEAMREIAMTDGPKKVSKFKLRPITAVSLSWMQRNQILDDDSTSDLLQRTAAFAYLHTADKSDIRAVVNDKQGFLSAVDEWMDANIKHHSELDDVSKEMSAAFEAYVAATTTASNPSDPTPPGPKN